jgi:hypothetical protein
MYICKSNIKNNEITAKKEIRLAGQDRVQGGPAL